MPEPDYIKVRELVTNKLSGDPSNFSIIDCAGINLQFSNSAGSKIGIATDEKMGFWNVTPVVQQVLATGGGASVDNVISLLQTLGLCKQS